MQLVARSTDQGKTWTFSALGPPIFTGTGSQTGLGWVPQGGPSGSFIATCARTPGTAATSGAADIVVQRSTDLGQTGTDPVVIKDDDPTQQFTHLYPQLGVAPNGRIDVVGGDNRVQHDCHFQVFYSYSTDGGVTRAHNVQVTDQPINFSPGVSFNSDIRQPPGVASANQYTAIGWGRHPPRQRRDPDPGRLRCRRPVLRPARQELDGSARPGGRLRRLGAAGIILVVSLSIRRRRPDSIAPRTEPQVVGAGWRTRLSSGRSQRNGSTIAFVCCFPGGRQGPGPGFGTDGDRKVRL